MTYHAEKLTARQVRAFASLEEAQQWCGAMHWYRVSFEPDRCTWFGYVEEDKVLAIVRVRP